MISILDKQGITMTYSLFRTDGEGDSGNMCDAFYWNEEGRRVVESNGRPRVGVRMMVGSHFARTMSQQDWWATTAITEILEERTNEDGSMYVKFRTRNSVYEWRAS